MTDRFVVSKNHLILGLCLPLAVLLGYILAEPLQSSSLGLLVMILSILVLPLLLRWYHPMLVFFWNTSFILGFLPGQLPVWMVVALVGFVLVVLNRCVGSQQKLMVGDSVAWALAALGVVVMLTALFTGGMGLRAIGSSVYGGRNYISIGAAITGYFVLASKRVPPEHAVWCMGLFFLPGLTNAFGDLIYMAGSNFFYLYYVISTGGAVYQAFADLSVGEVMLGRIGGVLTASMTMCFFLMARYGMRGILDLTRPWRMGLMIISIGIGMFGGFRSFLMLLGLVSAIMFLMERLHRTRYLLVVLFLGFVCAVFVVAFATKLPLSVQRSLSFLPINIHPAAKMDAVSTWEWRLEMWKSVFPQIPQYLLKGKGYAFDPGEMYLAEESEKRGLGMPSESAAVVGNYHNGPLSLLIPFGIWGVLSFGLFLFAATRILYRNYVFGSPALKHINCALFACFLARSIYFFVVFGSLYSDLAYLTGYVGLSMSLNGEVNKDASEGVL